MATKKRQLAMEFCERLEKIYPDAVCALAERKQDEWVRAHELRPVYLRAPQAERQKNLKELGHE